MIKIEKCLSYFLLFSLLLFSGLLFESFANMAITTGFIRANEVESVSFIYSTKTVSQKASFQQISDWYEDCDDISAWTDARGTDFEVNAFRGYQHNLTDSLIASTGVFTPENDWWNPPASNTTHRRAAVYRELPTNWTEILINSTINFDPTSISNPYTFQGGLYLILTNSNHEQLFELEISDGAASSGKHETYHHAMYFNPNDQPIELLPITLAASPVITNGKLSIHIKETTVEVFTPISKEWIDLGISPIVAFQRGTPKYVVLYYFQNRQLLQPPPTTVNWDFIETISFEKEIITDWFEDCNDISDWTDALGTDFETNTAKSPMTNSLIALGGTFIPDDGWWNPPASNTTHRRAAIYRELPSNWNELLINSTINFDPTSISNPYSFSGFLNLMILGPSLEFLFRVQIEDGASSNGVHETFHRAYYSNSSGYGIEVLPLEYALSPVITQGRLAIQITETTVKVFTPISDEWVDLGVSPSIAFQRGPPTYIVLYYFRYRHLLQPAPTALNWESIETITTDTSDRVPSPPRNLQAVAGDNQVHLSWEAPSDNGSADIIEYRVYRSTSPSHYTFLTITNSPEFIDTTVSNGLTYYYLVTAVNLAGESDLSATVTVTPISLSSDHSTTNSIFSSSSASEPVITPGYSFFWIILPIIIVLTVRRRKTQIKSKIFKSI
ncbi:MAG: fibronectin type III domain-containing protein [Candidatus Heimdallarchaeota archaeon]|nr:MAG: fibronectin type III domain-containing protein [Candidatus Heimdallarchaeota archaeon]